MQVDLAELARRVAPLDLTPDVPVYVLAPSQGLPAELANYPSAGVYAPWLDIVVREWLQAQGRWRGRGPAILLNDSLVREISLRDTGGDQALAEELHRGRLTGVFAHELSHVLGRPLELDDDYPASATILMRLALADPKPEPPPETNTPPPSPWEGHRADFVRVLCHVADRAERLLGERLPGPWMLDPRYCLAPSFVYRDALADELQNMTTASFAEIRDKPFPEPLLQLWRDDVKRYTIAYYRYQGATVT